MAEMQARWRAEELAERAGITTSTLRSYQLKGLIDPPIRQGRDAFYGPHHAQRLVQISALKARGYTLKAMAEHFAHGVRADEPVSDQASTVPLTLAEVATQANVPKALVRALERSRLLRPFQVDGQWVYHADDVEFVRRMMVLLDGGVALDDFVSLAEPVLDMFDQWARDVAHEWQAVVLDRLRAGQLPKKRQSEVLATSARQMAQTVGQLVAYNLERAVLIDVQAALDDDGSVRERKAFAEAIRGPVVGHLD